MNLTKSFAAMKTISISLLALLSVSVVRATISEPDNVLYGNITLDGALVTAARTDVVVEARRTTNGPAIASYRIGSDARFGNFYSLRLLLESVGAVSDTNASQVSQSVFIVVTDGSGLRAQTSYTIPERGVVQRVDFGVAAIDGDGDGLPDAWELQRYANLNQLPGSPSPNGLTALQNFIAGTDPNDPDGAFRLNIGVTNNLKEVSFRASKAEGPGYEGMTRIYSLEANPTLAAGSWSGVPNFIDLTGNNQTVRYLPGAAGPVGLFRGRVSLLGFTLPGGDSDGDTLPDAWETLHFGNLGQNAASINANGQTALQNYISGANPNSSSNLFRLVATRNGNNSVISFFAASAQGVGYEGRQRYYSLETSSNAAGIWTNVPGFSNIQGNNQTVTHLLANTSPRAFFRAKVWLSP